MERAPAVQSVIEKEPIRDIEISIEVLEKKSESLEAQANAVAEEALATEVAPEKAQEFQEKIDSAKDRFRKKISNLSSAAVLGSALLSSVTPLNPENFKEMKERAAIELLEKGITSEQKRAYVFGFNDLIYTAVVPRGYTKSSYTRGDSLSAPIDSANSRPLTVIKEIGERILNGVDGKRLTETPQREDAWRMYLGLAQKSNTFGISDHKPSRSKEEKYYYKFNEPEFLLMSQFGDIKERVRRIVATLETLKRSSYIAQDATVLNMFQWSKGIDEKGSYIAYYDKWDINLPIEKNGFFGKSFEIYDRIYYDPETYELIQK